MTPPDKRPLGFVNRRGHKQHDISADELSNLSIDDQPSAQPDHIVIGQTTPSHRQTDDNHPSSSRPRTRRSPKWNRKKSVVVTLIIVGIIVIPIGIGEALRIQYTASASAARQALRSLVASDVLPLQHKMTITAAELSTITLKLQTIRNDMCPGAIIDNMASLYPPARAAYDRCIAQRSALNQIITAQQRLTSSVTYIEKMTSILKRVVTPTTDSFAVITNQQSDWQAVSDQLTSLSPPLELKTGHLALIDGVSKVRDGWSKLNIANTEQNAQAFTAAEQQLSDGYSDVRKSETIFNEAITKEQVAMTEASKESVQE